MEVRSPNVAVLFLILTVQQLSLSFIKVSSVPKGLEELAIETRKDQLGRPQSDLFTLYFKNGSKCTANNGFDAVSLWCGTLNAAFHSQSRHRKICSCTCNFDFSTFLAQRQMCVDSTRVKKFGGKQMSLN